MTDRKHTQEYALYETAKMPHAELTKRVDQLVKELVRGETRSLICTMALAGIADPEAFMRDALEMAALNAGDSHAKWVRIRNKVREHLKGGPNDK